jgi:osmoprotectant transport system ATP-binding protein
MIEFFNVSKVFGTNTVVSDLTLAIPKGEFCVLIGPSGSGKSTILKMINRLVEHTTGEIHFAGEPIRSFPPEVLRRRMGYAIQSVGLFPHWTVARNIATVPRLLQWDEARVEARITELLRLLDLDAARFRDAYPHQLSGGQQQRVGVARALAADPDVLLMDEPFGALDPITRDSLQGEMTRIHAQTGKTIVFVTHDMDEALRLATRVVVLDKGMVVQSASPRELMGKPANDFVRAFMGKDDYGLKLLSVELVRERMRKLVVPCGSQSVLPEDSLRLALSRMLGMKANRIAVTDAVGTQIGTVFLDDLVT